MMKTGWWEVKFELTLEGKEVRWDDLDECTQEHIAEMIKEGYVGGEIVIEDDEDDDDVDDEEELICVWCGKDCGHGDYVCGGSGYGFEGEIYCPSCATNLKYSYEESSVCHANEIKDNYYDGVGKYPYLDNIVDDYNKLMKIVKDVKSLKDIENLVANKSFPISEIEINGMSVGFYKELKERGIAADIEWIRYDSFGCLDYICVFTEESRLPVFDVALETEGHLFENITIADIDDMESEYWEDVVRKHMNERDE